MVAPTFGGINLEDIAAPQCFEIEARLKQELNIPVMHDDQHGTAVVSLAGLINACKVTGRELKNCKIVLVGAGAAGVAIAKLIDKYAGSEIIPVDSKGIISHDRDNLNEEKRRLLEFANPSDVQGSLNDALQGADIFIGVSQPGLLTADMIAAMAKEPIIFALANPTPEIMPEEARKAGAAVVATGRSDFPNQINNALAFPGIFRGALDNRVQEITDVHKVAAAEAIASLVDNPTADEIVPAIGDQRLVPTIAAKIV
jgi:malate dehydrogenase (oxaloacetate-decarboxylating)